MSASAVRLWLGYRAEQYSVGAAGWTKFVKQLGLNFIPATWEAMAPFQLRTYVPSVLSPSGTTGLPEEVALLCYASVADYNRQEVTIAGRCYRLLHSLLFKFEAKKFSVSDWAVAGAAPGSPSLRPAAGGKRFEDAQAVIHFIALTHPATTLNAQNVWTALPDQNGDLAAWCRPGQSLIWIAATKPLDQQQTVSPLLALAAGSACNSWHVAQAAPTPLDQEHGVVIQEQSSLHFHR